MNPRLYNSEYEKSIDVLESLDSGDIKSTEYDQQDFASAVDQAANSLAFTQALWNFLVESEVIEKGPIDYSVLEGVIDGLIGELTAACMVFVTDPSADRIPGMLRLIADTIVMQENTNGKPVTPKLVIKGYRRLADRIERTKEGLDTTSESLP